MLDVSSYVVEWRWMKNEWRFGKIRCLKIRWLFVFEEPARRLGQGYAAVSICTLLAWTLTTVMALARHPAVPWRREDMTRKWRNQNIQNIQNIELFEKYFFLNILLFMCKLFLAFHFLFYLWNIKEATCRLFTGRLVTWQTFSMLWTFRVQTCQDPSMSRLSPLNNDFRMTSTEGRGVAIL